MARKDYFDFVDEFRDGRAFTAAAFDDRGTWKITDTSSAGTPTYAMQNAGGMKLTLEATSEVQNVCASFGDVLPFPLTKLREVEFIVKTGATTMVTGSSLAFGVASGRNDAIDSITTHASFRVIAADSTTAVVVETDDGTTDNDDIATGKTLINAYKRFVISFALGLADIRFFIDGQPVATGTTFSMSAGTAANMQPYVQIQKTATTNVDSCTIAFARARGNSGFAL